MSVVAKLHDWDAPAEPQPGQLIAGRYCIDRRLARGGMSSVYLGHRVETGEPVAIKFLRSTSGSDGVARKRFRREAQVLSQLSHPNCVSLIDAGHSGDAYVVMEYVEGKTLGDLLEIGPMQLPRAADVIAQVLAALDHAHSLGFIHRDVKPGNVMVEGNGRVLLLDFGLSKLRQDRSLTRLGLTLGTPPYMAPEHLAGYGLNPAADIYSTGVLLFELLAGRHPFTRCKSIHDLREAKKQSTPPRLADAEPSIRFPSSLDRVVARAMARDAKDRFPSARDFADALAEIVPVPARRETRQPHRRKSTPLSALLAGLEPGSPSAANPTGSGPKLSLVPPSLETPKPAAAASGLISLDTIEVLIGEEAENAKKRSKNKKIVSTPEPRRGPRRQHGPALIVGLVAGTLAFFAVYYWTSLAPPVRAALAAIGNELETAKTEFAGAVRGLGLDDTLSNQPAALTANTASEPREASESPTHVPSLAPTSLEADLVRIDSLVQRGRNQEAIASLTELEERYPNEAPIPYLLGNLMMAEKEWTTGAKAYQRALESDKSYKKDGRLIDNLVEALAGRRSSELAARLLGEIGRPGLSRLRRAVKRHKDRRVRNRAARLVSRLTRSRSTRRPNLKKAKKAKTVRTKARRSGKPARTRKSKKSQPSKKTRGKPSKRKRSARASKKTKR